MPCPYIVSRPYIVLSGVCIPRCPTRRLPGPPSPAFGCRSVAGASGRGRRCRWCCMWASSSSSCSTDARCSSARSGGGGDYIIASPRTAILPPLAKVPGSVAGHTYHVRFWVSAEGQVTRVEVEPPITDAGYSREFQQRMLAYQFYPARTRDGRNVASVVTVPLRIGN